MTESLLLIPLIAYGMILWRLGKFPKLETVPIGLGGGFTPHALRITRSKAYAGVTMLWLLLYAAMALSPPYIKETEWGYALADILPVAAIVILTYFFCAAVFLFKKCAEEDTARALENVPRPYIAYPEEEYPSCLIGTEEESQLLPLLQHAEISPYISLTPFPGSIREIPSTLVKIVREYIPDVRIQPLHPLLGQDIAVHLQQLEETSTTQAEKALDANKESSDLQSQITQLRTTVSDLQKSNETLNNKLLSVRTRTRGAGGATQDFSKMSREELDSERDKLMDTLRKLDDERRRKRG